MPDVNILIYAHRAEERHHFFYRSWLEEAMNGPRPVALSVLVAVGFVRIVTHPRYPGAPTPLAQALAVIDGLREHPNGRVLAPGARHLDLTADLCRRGGVRGKGVADAAHAAMALESGCTWVTRDGDFRRFTPSGLELTMLEPAV